jgi:hypothetical protein
MPAGMDLLLCWLIAPAGLLLAVVGLSLLVERLTGFVVPWAVRPALGLATAIVIAQFGTATDATAGLTLPLTLVLAVLGLVLGRRVPEQRPGAAEAVVAGGVFFLYALPFIVLGEATLAGYIKLDDTATWLAITDHVFEFGRGLGDLAPSTHQQVLVDYLGGSYPIGGFVPAALMSEISRQDIAFTMQPSMAFAAAAMALLLFELARRLVCGASLAAAVAIFASLASLLVGYYFWGGIKELVVAALLPLGPLLAGRAGDQEWPRGAWVSIGLAIVAMIVVLGPGGAVWVLPTLLPAAIAVLRNFGLRTALQIAWPVAAFSLLLALPVIFTPTGSFDPLNGGVTGEDELGNLAGPLNFFQLAGFWPSLDFRFDPHLEPAVIALGAICLAIAAVTTFVAARLGEGDGVPLTGYVGGGALGALAITYFGSPWVDAKVMATLSPALLVAALIGLGLLGQRTRFRLGAAALGLLVAGAVTWSAFLAYQGAWFAPRSHFAELEEIGERFAGEGPALSTEISIYGSRHFLRKLDAEGASDRRHRPIYLVAGGQVADGQYVDLDQIFASELDPYALLVVRRSAGESRPPGSFELAFQTDHYDVWRRRRAPQPPVRHLPLGTELDAGDIPRCSDLAELAQAAGEIGTLEAARVGTPIAIEFHQESLPSGWSVPAAYTFSPSGSGALSERFAVPEAGEYQLWLAGSVFGGLTLRVDGEEVVSERALIDNGGAYEPLGTARLTAGEHSLEIEYEGAGLSPGSAAQPWSIGPLVIEKVEQGDPGAVTVPAADYRRLCGKRWDWIEAYTG